MVDHHLKRFHHLQGQEFEEVFQKEAIEAIEEWEPRVDISKVTVNIEDSTLILRVEWIIKDGEEILITEVKYNVA